MYINRRLYIAFVQLRKQYYKLRTQKQIDKYSKIEFYINDYKTFKKFYNETKSICDDLSLVYNEPINYTTQDFFDFCLENTKSLKKTIL